MLVLDTAQTAKLNRRHYLCLYSLPTTIHAKNNCDNFINLMGAGFCIPAGDRQLTAHFTGVCSGAVSG
jgi:hypothetical protein